MTEQNAAFTIGKVHAMLIMAKDDLVMDKPKEALTKINDVLKIFESEIVPPFYSKEKNEQVNIDGN